MNSFLYADSFLPLVSAPAPAVCTGARPAIAGSGGADRSGSRLSNNDFKLVYEAHHPQVYAVAKRYLKSAADAEEVVQEVFMKLWLEGPVLKNGASLQAWVYTVAKNNTLNRLKRKAVEGRAIVVLKHRAINQHNDTAADKLREKDCQRLLGDALRSLSANQRRVFQLIREENLSYAEVAHQLNISPLTVKTHMARALSFLKRRLPAR